MLEIVYYLIYIFQGITAGVFMHLMLTPKYKSRLCMAVWTVAAIWQPAGRMLQMTHEDMKPIVLLSGIALFLVCCISMYKDPLWKKVTVVFLTLLATIFADCFCLIGFYIFDPSFLDANTGINIQTAIIAVAGEAAIVVVYIIMLIIWNLIREHRLIKGYLPTLLLPLSQLFFSVGANLGVEGHSEMYSVSFFIGEILGFIIDIYWMGELLYRSRRAEAQQELLEVRHKMELEQQHYLEIESKREEMARIRHDINNQLLAVRHLIEEGESQVAENMLTELYDKVKGTREYEYCGLPIVNAIISEKAVLCRQADIELRAKISIPDNISAHDVEICSIFSNLLDNAICAVSELETDNKYIDISAICEGGYLCVKTINPSKKPEKLRPLHGRGSVILTEIANRYNGSFKAQYSDGIYTAVVSMEI